MLWLLPNLWPEPLIFLTDEEIGYFHYAHLLVQNFMFVFGGNVLWWIEFKGLLFFAHLFL